MSGPQAVLDLLPDHLQAEWGVTGYGTQDPAEPYSDREFESAGSDGKPLVFHLWMLVLTTCVAPRSFLALQRAS